MRSSIRTFGLAAAATLAAMAIAGASPAVAEHTALCTADESLCAESNLVKHVHLQGPGQLLNSILNVSCTVLYLGGVLSPYLADPLHVVGNFTYTECEDAFSGECEANELSASSLISVLRTGVEEAEITGEGTVLVDCGMFIHCVYDGKGLTGEGVGPLVVGGNGVARIFNQSVNAVRGFLCRSVAKLDLLVSPLPNPIYISS